jgi:tRNA threonylcarbamoyl adenosine modification protein YeaZ/ribosomal-protein-alanine acetyltransferase
MLLAFDTCFSSCSAALFDRASQRVVAAQAKPMQTGQAEALPIMIDHLLTTADTTWDDIEEIAVTTGPGTFTGVRVGLSFAQGAAIARNLQICAIDTMVATAAPFLARQQSVTVVHSAGATGHYFVRKFSVSDPETSETVLQAPNTIDWSSLGHFVGTGVAAASGGKLHGSDFDVPIAERFAQYASGLKTAAPESARPHYMRTAHVHPNLSSPSLISLMATHASEIDALQFAAFGTSWGAESLRQTLSSPGIVAFGARHTGQLVAFAMARAAADEAELLIIAAHPMYQRKGMASNLLESISCSLKRRGIESLMLEVSADNTSATNLYQRFGFERYGSRPGYYQKNDGKVIDAVLMRKRLA